MKILMATHNFPPEFTGGVERSVEVLARDLVHAGHEVHVFSGSRHQSEKLALIREERHGIAVHRYRRREGYGNHVDTHDPACDAIWEQLLAKLAPDLVHVHHWYNLTNGLIAIAIRSGIPAVCTLHDFWTTCALFFRLPDDVRFCQQRERFDACGPCVGRQHPMEPGEMDFSFQMRFAALGQELALCSAILASSTSHVHQLAAYGRLPISVFSKVRVVPLGAASLDVAELNRLRKPRPPARPDKGPPPKLVVGHWGNLSRVKGLEVLVRAAAKSKSARRLRIKAMGECVDNALSVRLRDLAGAVQVDMPGAYDASQLPELLADVDVAVFPSLAMETHSLVLDEALFAGLPVIVSDRGALPERIGGRGIVVPAGDVKALAAALDRMADDDERARFAAARPGDLTDPATYARRVAELYEEVLRTGPGKRGAVLDFARDRLEFRNQRLNEIARYIGSVESRRDDVERALEGDQLAFERVRSVTPDLASRIARLLARDRK